MSSVTEIESAIRKLSMAEQKIIARHLDERLVGTGNSGACAAPDEGIRFLPQYESFSASRGSRGHKLRQRA